MPASVPLHSFLLYKAEQISFSLKQQEKEGLASPSYTLFDKARSPWDGSAASPQVAGRRVKPEAPPGFSPPCGSWGSYSGSESPRWVMGFLATLHASVQQQHFGPGHSGVTNENWRSWRFSNIRGASATVWGAGSNSYLGTMPVMAFRWLPEVGPFRAQNSNKDMHADLRQIRLFISGR